MLFQTDRVPESPSFIESVFAASTWIEQLSRADDVMKKTRVIYRLVINSLNHHDSLKHHFTSLKTQLIFLQVNVLEGKLP